MYIIWQNNLLLVCITTRVQKFRVYAQSVPSIHGHNGLDAMPLADSEIKDQLIKLHSLTDWTCFKLISQLFCCLSN